MNRIARPAGQGSSRRLPDACDGSEKGGSAVLAAALDTLPDQPIPSEETL
ncbi:hypothetical protein [Streptomyces malaysiense]|nr:hypothetical protein [Streptomyces malaysiense]